MSEHENLVDISWVLVGYLLDILVGYTCWIAKDTKGYHFFISQDSGKLCVMFKKISILINRLQKKDPVFSRLYFNVLRDIITDDVIKISS